MALDPKYILLPSIQALFFDKDFDIPLVAGTVKFYKDIARTELKPVFKLSGSPFDYEYVQEDNPIILNSCGSMQNAIYFYPYDSDGNVELYYIVVESSDGRFQFSREGWPNVVQSTNTGGIIEKNYVMNGQFLSHLVEPKTILLVEGEIRNPVTNIAYGGWTFERPIGSTAKDIVTFEQFGMDVDKNPRYSLNVVNELPSAGDTFKDVCLTFEDVNTFSSLTDYFTVAFEAVTTTENNVTIQLVIYKNYGTGGSTPDEQIITTFSITPNPLQYYFAFVFGDNEGKTIGTENDDYVQVRIRYPVNSLFGVKITNVLQAEGNIISPIYPYSTNEQAQYESIPGKLPIINENGEDLYLPIILTQKGFDFDRSQIGRVFLTTNSTLEAGELRPKGQQLETDGYDSNGIPFSRLQKIIFNTDKNIPQFGTGDNYFSGSTTSVENELLINNNFQGLVNSAIDGSNPTGFTFLNTHIGNDIYYVKSYIFPYLIPIDTIAYNQFYIENINATVGGIESYGVGTSGFTVSAPRPNITDTFSSWIIAFKTISATTLASKYFYFESTNVSINYKFYVWYKVAGSGTDPAPSGKGSGILVQLNGTEDAYSVAEKTRQALNGWQVSSIIVSDADAIPQSSYFLLYSITQAFYVWYNKDGVGVDPKITGKIGIEVKIGSLDLAAVILTKTIFAINSKYFKIPNLSGMFFRAVSEESSQDPDREFRYSLVPGIFSNMLGTFELSENIQHFHPSYDPTLNFVNIGGSGGGQFSAGEAGISYPSTGEQGGNESRPANISLYAILKY